MPDKGDSPIGIFFELVKIRITVAVALTTTTGYLLSRGAFTSDLVLVVFGLFLLACASAALNQYQEADYDKLMDRTKNRPIPSGRISKPATMVISILLTILGSVILYAGSDFLSLQLGWLALIWYNVIYTYLKRKTPFAVVPGSIIGSIPPVVGWVAGGGELLDARTLILAIFFFIWQIPHFWLLVLKYGDDYEKAGFPSITSVYSEKQVRFITFIWTLATAITALMLPMYGVVSSVITLIIIVLASGWLVWVFRPLIRPSQPKESDFKPYFMRINYFVLIVTLILSADRFIS